MPVTVLSSSPTSRLTTSLMFLFLHVYWNNILKGWELFLPFATKLSSFLAFLTISLHCSAIPWCSAFVICSFLKICHFLFISLSGSCLCNQDSCIRCFPFLFLLDIYLSLILFIYFHNFLILLNYFSLRISIYGIFQIKKK